MDTMTIQRVLELYNVPYISIRKPQSGYRNDSYPIRINETEYYNLLFYKREPHIESVIRKCNALSNYLSTTQLPVRTVVDPRIIKLTHESYTRYACLYTYLPGSTIPWEAYTRNHIKLIGKTLSHLHSALKKAPQISAPDITETNHTIATKMINYFTSEGVMRAMQLKLHCLLPAKTIQSITEQKKTTSDDVQLLHMDFVRGNILFAPVNSDIDTYLVEGKVNLTGIIDFEKASYGTVTHDIARTLAFLLVDCKFKTEQQVYKYFLHSGYLKRGGGTPIDTDKLEDLINFYLLYDFYKFLLHNPFEYLKTNEHYMRTFLLLKKRGIIETTS